MSDRDRLRWDLKYAGRPSVAAGTVTLPSVFEPFADLFPSAGYALDLGCGRGAAAIWLADRGMEVQGFDVSPVAIAYARDLAVAAGVTERCRFDVADLDDGLPAGPPAAVMICHKFRDSRLDGLMLKRLAPGGLLAISALSEGSHGPKPFRVRSDELSDAFGALEVIDQGERHNVVWLLARKGARHAAEGSG